MIPIKQEHWHTTISLLVVGPFRKSSQKLRWTPDIHGLSPSRMNRLKWQSIRGAVEVSTSVGINGTRVKSAIQLKTICLPTQSISKVMIQFSCQTSFCLI